MGCSPPKHDNTSKVIIIQEIRNKRISTVQELEIDATSFVMQGTGLISENYTITDTLSTSPYGIVQKAIHIATQQIRAIKSINKSLILQNSLNLNKFFHEIEVLKLTDHPNIVHLFEFYEDTDSYHLVTEFIEGGEFFDFIVKNNSLSETTASYFMRQLLSAMFYCHSKKIVHRDLKPENLLMDKHASDANLKIIDFGISTILDAHDNIPQQFGSTFYIAPEVFDKIYDEKCDI